MQDTSPLLTSSTLRWDGFLHTPFPSSEIYRTLPVREEVLRAVLKADLIGFHTYDYARHFVSACTRILGLEVDTARSSTMPDVPLHFNTASRVESYVKEQLHQALTKFNNFLK